MRTPRVLAVDIGAGHVACGVFTAGATGRLVLQRFDLEPLNSDPAHEARWSIEVAQALGALATRSKMSGSASLAVPGHLALTKFIKTPSINPAKRSKIIAFEAAENIPYPLEEVVWDHQVVADDGFDLEVMLTAAKFDAMTGLCTAADAAGFPAERAIPSGLALFQSFRYNHAGMRDSVIVVEIGARSSTLLFIEDTRFYLRTLALGGNAITQAIAEELRIDFVQAETLKVQVLSGKSDLLATSPSRAAVQRATAAFSQKIQLEITRSAVNHRRNSANATAVALYLTGGGSQIAELPALLAEKLRIRVERYNPLANVDLGGDARAAGAESAAAKLADFVGVASRVVVKDESAVTLLPPAVLDAIAFRKRQPVVVAAAMFGALALLPPILYFNGLASANEAKIEQVDGQLMPLRALQTRNQDNLQQIEDAKKQITALQSAYDTKANWINFFTDLQSRLVKIEDVWIDRLQIVRPAPGDQPVAETPPPPPADGSTPAAPPAQPMKLTLSGRLLDVANPQSKVSPEARERVKQLLASLSGPNGSQFIASVEDERFDNTMNGLLRFDFTLVINPKKPL